MSDDCYGCATMRHSCEHDDISPIRARIIKGHAEIKRLCEDVMAAQEPGEQPRLSLLLAMEHLNAAKFWAEMGKI